MYICSKLAIDTILCYNATSSIKINTMSIEQVHFDEAGPIPGRGSVIYNRPPENHPVTRAWVDSERASTEAYRDKFLADLEGLPNHNEGYADELATLNAIAIRDGLEPPAMTVLSSEDFDDLGETSGAYPSTAHAVALFGNIIIADIQYPIPALRKRNIIVKGLHELGHAKGDEQPVVVSHTTLGAADTPRHRTYLGPVFTQPDGSLRKSAYTAEKGFHYKDEFLDEARAHLYCVSHLEELGMEVRLKPRTYVDTPGDVRYVAADITPRLGLRPDGKIEIPAKYMDVLLPGGIADEVTPAYAAYGLELLDQYLQTVEPDAPRLSDQMWEARDEPTLQREVIRRIERVQRGLYGELRQLSDSAADFKRGLLAIQSAIVAARDHSGESRSWAARRARARDNLRRMVGAIQSRR